MAVGLAERYKKGLGFKRGDRLVPRPGCRPTIYGLLPIEVWEQCALIPHKYTALAERPEEPDPARRIVLFEINGHEWEIERLRRPRHETTPTVRTPSLWQRFFAWLR